MTRIPDTTTDQGGTSALVSRCLGAPPAVVEVAHVPRRRRPLTTAVHDDRGAAAVEFALILLPLMILVFGILGYGYMLSFRQAISQAAAEGVRAAAVAPAGLGNVEREARALTAVDNALGYGITCASAGMTCTVTIAPGCGAHDCAQVRLHYAYAANPLIPSFPFVPLPANLVYETSAAVS